MRINDSGEYRGSVAAKTEYRAFRARFVRIIDLDYPENHAINMRAASDISLRASVPLYVEFDMLRMSMSGYGCGSQSTKVAVSAGGKCGRMLTFSSPSQERTPLTSQRHVNESSIHFPPQISYLFTAIKENQTLDTTTTDNNTQGLSRSPATFSPTILSRKYIKSALPLS
jgi:hypothetical protein